MFHACQQPKGLLGLIVEGGHPGLQDAEARHTRLASDRNWARRFRTEPLDKVFTDWFQQPVFATLTDTQRDALITLRSQNSGVALAMMLEATSLALQPDLRAALSAVRHLIPNAGHNAHRENPEAVSASLVQILRLRIKDTL